MARPSKLRRIFWGLLAACLLTGLLLIAFVHHGYWGGRSVNLQLLKRRDHWLYQQVAAQGGTPDYAAVLNRHYSQGVTAENNFFVALIQLGGLPETESLQGMEIPALSDSMTRVPNHKEITAFLAEHSTTLTAKDLDDVLNDVLDFQNLTRQQHSELRKVILGPMAPLKWVQQELNQRDRYYCPFAGRLGGSQLHHYQMLNWGRWFVLRSEQSIADGDLNSAEQDVRSIFQLADRVSQSPDFTGQAIAVTLYSLGCQRLVSLLNHSSCEPEALDRWQALLKTDRLLERQRECLDVGQRGRNAMVLQSMVSKDELIRLGQFIDQDDVPLLPGWVNVQELADASDAEMDRILSEMNGEDPASKERLFDQRLDYGTTDWIWKQSPSQAVRDMTRVAGAWSLQFRHPASRAHFPVQLRFLVLDCERRTRMLIAWRRFEWKQVRGPLSYAELQEKSEPRLASIKDPFTGQVYPWLTDGKTVTLAQRISNSEFQLQIGLNLDVPTSKPEGNGF